MPGAMTRSLLLVQPRWMGDVLLCTPAIHAARRALPDARIEFLTERAGAAVLADNPDLDGIVVAGERGTVPLLGSLRRSGYDAVVDFRSTGSTALFSAATGARVRVGLRGRGFRNLAYTHLLPKERRAVYMARQKLDMLGVLGIETRDADLRLRITVDEPARRRAAAVWRECGFGDDPVVAISAVSRIPYKQWGTDNWAAVGDAVAALGARVLLTSGPAERDAAAATAARMTAVAAWDYGDTTLRELAALYARCALWIGNDGGPKHIAAAAGAPTITVFRFPIGAVWTDDSDGRHDALEPDGAADVSVERVVARAEQRLRSPSR